MSDITIALDHLESKLPQITKNLENSDANNSIQLTGMYFGTKIGISILGKFKDIPKVTRTDRRKVKILENNYLNNSAKYCEKMNIDIFAYEFAVNIITKTTGLIIGDIDLDKFLSH